eukprot:GHVT01099060.1.p2 GENE.GHVT01099060.1~~GHVT01099060.1.p2  ORF type:complete len:113 (+),score=3.63 GHVT01099060.1:939-1277(+)
MRLKLFLCHVTVRVQGKQLYGNMMKVLESCGQRTEEPSAPSEQTTENGGGTSVVLPKIASDDIEFLCKHFFIVDKAIAERKLAKNNGDLQATLLSMITATNLLGPREYSSSF